MFFYTIYRTFADLNDQDVIFDEIQSTKHFFDDLQKAKNGTGYTSLE